MGQILAHHQPALRRMSQTGGQEALTAVFCFYIAAVSRLLLIIQVPSAGGPQHNVVPATRFA